MKGRNMVMTNQVDFLDLIFGDKAGTVNDEGTLNFYVPTPREMDQQLDMDELLHNSDLTLAPDFIEDSFLADDTCVPNEVVVIDSSDTTQEPTYTQLTPSTSGSQLQLQQQQEQIVFQFPPTESFQELLESEEVVITADEVTPSVLEDGLTSSFTDTTSFTDAGLTPSVVEDSLSEDGLTPSITSPCPSTPFSPGSSYSESLPPPTPDTASSVDSLSAHIPTFLKHGLRSSILEKRRKEGKEEIKILFTPPEPEKLTAEEEAKRQEKRERNKLAAQKCRNKKRQIADVLEEQTKKLEKEQRRHKLEIQKLIEERDRLMDIITVHGSVCPKLRAVFRVS